MARITPEPAKAVEALSKARIKLMRKPDCAFFATLVLQSPVYWVTADEVPTAATDGINLFFNPEFFLGLDPDERVFLILHEIMHNVYHHTTRCGFRKHDVWNKAGDYVINDELIRRNFKMPKGGLHDIDYRDWSADAVYQDLIEKEDKGDKGDSNPWPDLQPPQPGGSSGSPDPNGNGQSGIGGIPQPSKEEVESHNTDLLSSATQMSKMQNDKPGTIPGELERVLDDALHPKLPWYEILSQFLFSMNKNDYSWRKPNRRLLPMGIIMPSLYSEGVGRIDFAIDTSGSVSDDDFNHFMSEIGYVFKRFNPQEIGIMQFDHILQGNDRICTPQDFLNLKFKGGGGTRIEPVLDVFKTNTAKALIILTDGYLNQTADMDPGKPVVWCVYGNPSFVPSFGTVIHFEKD